MFKCFGRSGSADQGLAECCDLQRFEGFEHHSFEVKKQ